MPQYLCVLKHFLRTTKNLFLCKRVFSHLLSLLQISAYIVGAKYTLIILTDTKLVTHVFETKLLPPEVSDACDLVDLVIQKNFVIAHVLHACLTSRRLKKTLIILHIIMR